jgi:hypothetical protein
MMFFFFGKNYDHKPHRQSGEENRVFVVVGRHSNSQNGHQSTLRGGKLVATTNPLVTC